jgi:hypothetical protein
VSLQLCCSTARPPCAGASACLRQRCIADGSHWVTSGRKSTGLRMQSAQALLHPQSRFGRCAESPAEQHSFEELHSTPFVESSNFRDRFHSRNLHDRELVYGYFRCVKKTELSIASFDWLQPLQSRRPAPHADQLAPACAVAAGNVTIDCKLYSEALGLTIRQVANSISHL